MSEWLKALCVLLIIFGFLALAFGSMGFPVPGEMTPEMIAQREAYENAIRPRQRLATAVGAITIISSAAMLWRGRRRKKVN